MCTFIRMTRHRLQQPSGIKTLTEVNNNEVNNNIEDRVFTVGDLEVDMSKRLTKRRGQIIKLTPKEYKLLAYMVRDGGKVLSHKELLQNVWGPEYGREYEYLRTFIWQLRQKIEDDPSNPQFIVTEPSVGYRLIEPG